MKIFVDMHCIPLTGGLTVFKLLFSLCHNEFLIVKALVGAFNKVEAKP